MLGVFGGGLAAGAAGVAVGRWLWDDPVDPADTAVRLTAVNGAVSVRAADGAEVGADRPVPPGGTVATHGLGSSVVLAYPDGSAITLNGDSAATLTDHGRRVVLRHGAATAAVRPQPAEAVPFTLVTAQVALPGVSGALMTLDQAFRATDVGVHQGQVTVSAHTGEPLALVRAGEVLTVRADGGHRKQPLGGTPEAFAWDLTRPLPEGWHVGRRELTPDGPVVRPDPYPDPYYNGTVMHQVRSDKQWTRGFFRLAPDSLVRVRYRVEREGKGQVCFCVRTPDTRSPETGMLEWNGVFVPPGPAGWRWLELRAEEMLLPPNKHVPRFWAPWVGFLVILNTYQDDLGLTVAEFRVAPPRA
jgi:hypothetical protein